MIAVLLIVVPLLSGLITFFFRNEKTVRAWGFFSALVTLALSLAGILVKDAGLLSCNAEWMPALGSRFAVQLDGLSQLLTLLTGIAYPLILLATWNTSYKRSYNFYALMLLAQAGLMGVFLATDALVFYFFWELALIPAYFLCSQWGGEKRIAVTFKFFVYTFIGSLMMLVGILYVYGHTATHSFSLNAFYHASLSNNKDQIWLFWLFFIAFAVKMPIFPFHTWQPDTYEQSPTAVTMVLSGLMVKMGVFGVLRWLLPVLPDASYVWGNVVSALSVIGMLYASLIAMKQDDMKRLVAYSSIAHIGLMSLAIFSVNETGMQGVMLQLFSHGINIIGMWIVVEIIERQFGTRKMSQLGGIAQQAPALAIFFVIIALANIALPLTNAFVGEFLMFTGIFNSVATTYYLVFTVLAGICIILGAVYTLNMLRKVLYGDTVALTVQAHDIRLNEKLALTVIVVLIFWVGVYSQPFLHLTSDLSTKTTDIILKKSEILPYLRK